MESVVKSENTAVAAELQQEALVLGLTSLTYLKGGHTEAVLCRALDAAGNQRVLKIGSSQGVNNEVDDNIFGYEQIHQEGAEHILPDGMTFGEIDGRRYIIMPYLGIDIAERDRSGNIEAIDYTIFADTLTSIASKTIQEHEGTSEMIAGLEVVRAKLDYWFNRLVVGGAISQEELVELMDIDISELVSNKTSLMIMDMTPDNMFIDGDKVSFIDPWKQDIYRGSFIPSLGQFITLATEVYGLTAAREAHGELHRSIETIGHSLGLTHDQIHAQGMLGSALQYALSGFVRLESDPTLAGKYIKHAKDAVKAVKNDIIQLKKENK